MLTMAITISTKYVGPTNTRGSRVKAVTGDNALNSLDNHKAAAKALAERLNWDGEWQGGDTETGYVFIRFGSNNTFKVKG